MNFNEAMTAVAAGKRVTRPRLTDSYTGEKYFNGNELDGVGLTRQDFSATDWEVEPSDFTVTEETLIRAWNTSLPEGAPEMNHAPGSGRFKRFVEALRS